ncbi:ORF6N domain-containing protein [Chryseobacterium taichungense]|uniref:ORF6N domain-containing protein n=1 Tax=Chryseobacterium taichungense TaxID=295069 RepID=UPI000A98BB95|nr:ORF6N domain-containing protein [Chryseobacterium taichungense]
MLDSDLAFLYQVETKNLNKAVKRNIESFPASFLLSTERGGSQQLEVPIWNLKFELGGRRYLPDVFTE